MKPSSPALLIGFGEGKPAAGEQHAEEGTGALAGKALASALKSGDGQAIYDAFEALVRECDDKHGGDDEEMDEPIAAE